DERYDLARDTIRGFAGDLLGDPAKVDDDCGFEEMDMDSIMMIDLGDLLSHAMDDDLSAVVAINYPTIQELARHLTTLVREEPQLEPGSAPEPNPASAATTAATPPVASAGTSAVTTAATPPVASAVTSVGAPASVPDPHPQPQPDPAERELTEEELLEAIRRDLAMEL